MEPQASVCIFGNEAELHFARIADELDVIAEAVRKLKPDDRELAIRLQEFAQQIRIDSGLAPTGFLR